MMTPFPYTALISLFTGAGAVEIRALAEYATPPASYMGGKRDYASAILRAGGCPLHLGRNRPERLFLNDMGPWGRVWPILSIPAGAEEVARRILEWDSNDPAEWYSIRDTGYEPWDEAGVARWLFVAHRSFRAGAPSSGWVGSNPRHPPSSSSRQAKEIRSLARLFPPITVVTQRDAHTLSPGEVADSLSLPSLKGTLVYMDPPYAGTTGYRGEKNETLICPREEVLDIGRRFAEAGAAVMISEGEPLPIHGWHASPLALRAGTQGRNNFTRSDREWLTTSFPPHSVSPVQADLFAALTSPTAPKSP